MKQSLFEIVRRQVELYFFLRRVVEVSIPGLLFFGIISDGKIAAYLPRNPQKPCSMSPRIRALLIPQT